MKEYDINRFDKSFDIAKCRESAESGYARAQYNLGECYHQDWAQAVEWYRKAAEQGLPEALHSLGDCYMGGFGVPKDKEQALVWYRKAVDAGDETAQWLLDFFTGRNRQSDGQDEADGKHGGIDDEWKLRRCNLGQHKLAHAKPTSFQYDLEHAFGDGKKEDDDRGFLRELDDCKSEAERWRMLCTKVGHWLHTYGYSDWEQHTDIDGVYGWYVSLAALRLPIPQQPMSDTEYNDWLYYVTVLADHVETDDKSWNAVTEGAEEDMDYNMDSIGIGCYVKHGYFSMTSEQWIAELRELRWLSWEAYIEWQKNYAEINPGYMIAMHEGYPAYDAIVDRLEREAAGSEVVCINKYGEDIDVWYFARTADSMFVVIVSDSM